MNDVDPRYSSGNSLVRTKKEEALDRLEHTLGDMTDEVYLDLKRLKIDTLWALGTAIDEVRRDVEEACQKKKTTSGRNTT